MKSYVNSLHGIRKHCSLVWNNLQNLKVYIFTDGFSCMTIKRIVTFLYGIINIFERKSFKEGFFSLHMHLHLVSINLVDVIDSWRIVTHIL